MTEIKRFDHIQEDSDHKKFMQRAIDLAIENVKNGGGPFGAVIVKNGKIVGEGFNRVTRDNDPTAHAEITAIRNACENMGTFQLNGCIVYTSCYPCSMCYSAIYWARPDIVYYGCTAEDAAEINFDDAFIYKELSMNPNKRRIKAIPLMRDESLKIFKIWKNKSDKISY